MLELAVCERAAAMNDQVSELVAVYAANEVAAYRASRPGLSRGAKRG